MTISRSSPTVSSATCTGPRWWAGLQSTGSCAALPESANIFPYSRRSTKEGFVKIATSTSPHSNMYLPYSTGW